MDLQGLYGFSKYKEMLPVYRTIKHKQYQNFYWLAGLSGIKPEEIESGEELYNKFGYNKGWCVLQVSKS